jgi:hypothetical protein
LGSKEKTPSKIPRVHKEVGFSAGTNIIYNMADFIYVNNQEGTLYLGSRIPGLLFNYKQK